MSNPTVVSGLYLITFPGTDWYYGGRARNIEKRMRAHRNDLRLGRHVNRHMQSVFNKHGDFTYRLLVECSDSAQRKVLEQEWLDSHFGKPGCLNKSKSSEGGGSLGMVHTPEAREKIRIASTGRRHTPEACAKIGDAHRGMTHTPEAIVKISAGRNNGKWALTEEGREKVGAIHKGKPKSPDVRAKMSASNVGKHMGPRNRLTERDVQTIRRRYAAGETCAQIAVDYPVGVGAVRSIIRKETWGHLLN